MWSGSEEGSSLTDHGWGTWRYFHMWPFCEIHSRLELIFFRQMFSLEMIWRTTRMLHGEGGKVASHQKGSGLDNSPVWTGFLINQAPFLMAMSPNHNAQVLRMNSSTSPRIKQSGIYSHFEINSPENIRLKDICRRKFYFADCSCSMNAILAGYLKHLVLWRFCGIVYYALNSICTFPSFKNETPAFQVLKLMVWPGAAHN